MLITPIKSLGYVSRTNQSVVFVLWFERCLNFNQVMGGIRRERFVNWNHLLEREMLAFLCFYRVFYRILREMRHHWTDERYQVTYSKRVTHAVKMVDSCTRENGVLCTVARSWLLFLHDESEWKIFESNIAWGVDELHQTFWFEQFFNGKLCCKIHDLLSVPIIFFWIGLLGAISRWMSD